MVFLVPLRTPDVSHALCLETTIRSVSGLEMFTTRLAAPIFGLPKTMVGRDPYRVGHTWTHGIKHNDDLPAPPN